MTASINASTSSGVVVTSDTSGSLAVQSNGTTKFTVDSTGAYGQITSGTAVASTSGTSIDFTSIPSWVKRVTVMFSGVSTNGTSIVQVQIGAGSVTTSGYTSYTAYAGGTTAGSNIISTGCAFDAGSPNAGVIRYGTMVLSLVSSNNWIFSLTSGLLNTGTAYSITGGGGIALGGTLDRVRITTVNGTDTFDAGSINILYE